MSPLVSRPPVELVDTHARTRTPSSGRPQRLRTCSVEPWGLRTEWDDPGDPFVVRERCRLLPTTGLRLRRRWHADDPAASSATEIGAVRIEVDGPRWRTTDLLLGLTVPVGRRARVVHDADFAAALHGGVLTPADADEAMSTVHRVLGELVDHRHDLDRWLTALGVPTLDAAG